MEYNLSNLQVHVKELHETLIVIVKKHKNIV
jgi:hypothetical protein